MSLSSQRGKLFELKVAKMLRHNLHIAVERDRRSGAGLNKSDISDYWQQLPLHLELKDQETIKIKEWFRQADVASSFNLVPAVVFAADEDVLVTLRFTDLLQFLIQITDQKAEIDDLRQPVVMVSTGGKPMSDKTRAAIADVGKAVAKQIERGTKTCKNGHIADDYGYCLQADCKYSRGYRPQKGKK